MRTTEGKVKVDHPRSKSKASQIRKRREGFSVPTGRSRFEKVFALYISPAGRRGRTEEQIMLNQARYFLPGMTSDNCQKITSWNFNIYTMWNGNGARSRNSHVDSQSVDKEEENRAEWKERGSSSFSRDFSGASASTSRCSKHGRKQKGLMARYLFRNAQILDAERGDYLADGSVLVEGDRILEVGGADVYARGAQSFELVGLAFLPGLIDAPVHVPPVTAHLARLAEWAPAYVTARTAHE